MTTLKPACDLTLKERAAALVFIVGWDGGVRYVNGVTGCDIAPAALVRVPEVAS
jgi:hypothetical protein